MAIGKERAFAVIGPNGEKGRWAARSDDIRNTAGKKSSFFLREKKITSVKRKTKGKGSPANWEKGNKEEIRQGPATGFRCKKRGVRHSVPEEWAAPTGIKEWLFEKK